MPGPWQVNGNETTPQTSSRPPMKSPSGQLMLSLLCLVAAVAAAAFAYQQDQLLRQRYTLYQAVERETAHFVNESAMSEIDERLEISRRSRDGALGIGAILLVTPMLLWVVRRRNERIRTKGGAAEDTTN